MQGFSHSTSVERPWTWESVPTYSIIFDEPDHGNIRAEAFKAKFENGSQFEGQGWDRLLGKYTVQIFHLNENIDLLGWYVDERLGCNW